MAHVEPADMNVVVREGLVSADFLYVGGGDSTRLRSMCCATVMTSCSLRRW